MAFYLKPKKYDLRYLLGMPLACEPLCTIGVVAQKVLTGVVNVLWVLVEAEFIDKAVRLVTGGGTLADCCRCLPPCFSSWHGSAWGTASDVF